MDAAVVYESTAWPLLRGSPVPAVAHRRAEELERIRALQVVLSCQLTSGPPGDAGGLVLCPDIPRRGPGRAPLLLLRFRI
jgi:hypothetical protein